MWGKKISSSQIGPFTGTVTAYVAQVPLKQAQITVFDVTTYSGNPGTIPLSPHDGLAANRPENHTRPGAIPVLNYYKEY